MSKTLSKGSEEYKQAEDILTNLLDEEEADPFSVPVDWKLLGLDDYPKIVKKPMDLGTVSDKLEQESYQSLHEFATDVRQVWVNAQKYNQPGSGIFLSSENLSAKFESMFSKITKKSNKRKRASSAADESNGTSNANSALYADKVKFSQLVNKLTSQQLGNVVEMLQDKCPESLNEEDDLEIEIEVDNIDKDILDEVNKYAESCINGQ